MDALKQTRDVSIWFFQKLRERGRDRSYLKPIDNMVKKIDDYANQDIEHDMEIINQLNKDAVALIESIMDREQSEFVMKPEFTPQQLELTDGN